MSSHREAPEISKDPVADNTDVYAFVSPGPPGHGDDHRQLHPVPESAGRPELLRVRRRRAVRDPRQQPRRRPLRHRLPVPVHHQDQKPEHVPLQHRSDHQDRRRQLEPSAVLLGHPAGTAPAAQLLGQRSARAAGQRRGRAARRTTPRRSPRQATHMLRGGRHGLRRPAGRGIQRRPGQHLRSRHPAAVPDGRT